MAQIKITNLTFYYDDYYHPVFENLNLNLDTSWKIALIGRNGRGKSTLLRLLQGSLEPTSGQIDKSGNVSYFPYPYSSEYSMTLDVIKECIGELRTLELIMERTCHSADAANVTAYFDALERYTSLDGYEMEARIYRELAQMQFPADLTERDFHTLSGGEQTCMLIIALFLRKEPFVLLDEPTNHLDQEKKLLLQEYLKKKKGYIIASHDTFFLDEVSLEKAKEILKAQTFGILSVAVMTVM